MGKYGIGAKVKDPDGDFGEIIGKPAKGLRTIRINGGKHDGMEIQFLKSELEVVANDNTVSACAPVFEKEYSVGDRVRVKSGNNIFRAGTPAGCEGTITAVYGAGGSLNLDHPMDGTIEQVCSDFARHLERLPTVTTTWAKGDRALSMNGDYVTVDTDPDTDNHVWVSFGTTKWRTPVDMLAKWEPKVGDRVKLVKDGMSTTSAVGKIATLEAWADGSYIDDGQYLLNIDGPVDYETRAVDEKYTRATIDCFDPLPVAVAEATATPWEPKIGEKVRVVRAGADFKEKQIGVEFVVTNEDSIWDGERSWYSQVRGKNAGGWRYKTSELEPVVVEPAAPPAKFKVGDRVNWTYSRGSWQGITIESINDSQVYGIIARCPVRGTGAFSAADLELAPTLAIGSTVTFTATGRLSAINDNGHLQVTFPDLAPAQNSFALPAKFVTLA